MVSDLLSALTWLEWTLLGLLILAAVLALVAWTGERHADEALPPRPLPLPAHRPEHAPAPEPQELDEYAARHSQELRERTTLRIQGDRRMPGTFWVVKDRQQAQWPWRGVPEE